MFSFRTMTAIGLGASVLLLTFAVTPLNVTFLIINAALFLQACWMEAEDEVARTMTTKE